jgi:hypothetical protein
VLEILHQVHGRHATVAELALQPIMSGECGPEMLEML